MRPEEIPAWEPFLRRAPLFEGMSSQDIARIALRFSVVSLPKGSTLFKQGAEPDALYIVASGQVRVTHDELGGERVAARLGYGEVLGEGGLLTGEPRSMTVKLDTSCEFLRLSRQDFESLLRDIPEIALHLSQMLTKRLVAMNRLTARRSARLNRLLALVCGLGRTDRVLFGLHLAFQTLEQTRRRVLIVDLSEDAGEMAKALKLQGKRIGKEDLRSLNTRDPLSMRGLAEPHPSGLSILSLSPDALGGFPETGVFLFLNALRGAYDFAFVLMGAGFGSLERTVVSEADEVFLVASEGARPQFRQIEADVLSAGIRENLFEVFLGDAEWEEWALSPSLPRQVIPWPTAIHRRFLQTDNAFEAMRPSPKSEQGIGRLARRIGGLKVGLAMSAGAALGYTLIGVLKVFKREGIPVDILAGTSMGALIAGFAASGMEPEEIEQVALAIDKQWVYKNLGLDLAWLRAGIFRGDTLLAFLRTHLGTKRFSDMDIPFACVACDIQTGEEVVLREGEVADAVRASCGLPIFFRSMSLGGRFLVDGGLVNPVPTSVTSALGADILLSVDLTVPPPERVFARLESERQAARAKGSGRLKELGFPEEPAPPGIVNVFFQMIYTMEYEIAQKRAHLADVIIWPNLKGFSWADLHRAKELIAVGERAAEEQAGRIKALLPYFADYCRMPLRLLSTIANP